MIRNFAVTLFIIALIVVFQPYLKAEIFEARNKIALSRVDMDEEKKDQLKDALSRISIGYRQDVFTDVEKETLIRQLAMLQSHAGKSLSEAETETLIRRLETLLERYKL